MAVRRKPVTHGDVASSWGGPEGFTILGLRRRFGGADGVLGVNSGLLPGVSAFQSCQRIPCFVQQIAPLS